MLKYYFINKFDTNLIDKQSNDTILIYRNYSNFNLENILNIKKYSKKKKLKFLLSNNTKLALKLKLDGVYLPSFNKKTNHLSFAKPKDFLIIGSAHNLKEIRVKELQGAKIIFISSLFKRNKNYLGINRFKFFSKLTKMKIVALGGISTNNIKKINLLNCAGIAGISFFETKKAPKKGPF
jgi:thiamine-phosphate pyrophosphorylase